MGFNDNSGLVFEIDKKLNMNKSFFDNLSKTTNITIDTYTEQKIIKSCERYIIEAKKEEIGPPLNKKIELLKKVYKK